MGLRQQLCEAIIAGLAGGVLPRGADQPVAGGVAVAYYEALCYKLMRCGLEVIDMPTKGSFRGNIDDLCQAYLAGTSITALAQRHHIGQAWIKWELKVRGINVRDRSGALHNRWRLLGPRQRERLVAAAHAATRGCTIPLEQRQRVAEGNAKTRQERLGNVGRFEDTLREMLEQRALVTFPQQAVCGYNLDLGIAPIAVEVHVTANNPLTDSTKRKRIKRLLEANWSLVYVWITSAHPLIELAADQVVSLRDLAGSLPAGGCKYWVIRGSGQIVESGMDPYKRT